MFKCSKCRSLSRSTQRSAAVSPTSHFRKQTEYCVLISARHAFPFLNRLRPQCDSGASCIIIPIHSNSFHPLSQPSSWPDFEDSTYKWCLVWSYDHEQSSTTNNRTDGLSLNPPPCTTATQIMSDCGQLRESF